MSKRGMADCENCTYYIPDTEAGDYICCAPFDEDEVAKAYGEKVYECPYFNLFDEYKIVRKQN